MTYGDPRRGLCHRKLKEPQPHVWRDGNFWPDGRTRCIYCSKRRRVKR